MRWFSGVLLALFVSGFAMAETHNGYEIPKYVVAATQGPIELRKYSPHLVAEYTTQGSRQSAVGKGFRALAGYIFGKNARQEKIAMTAPVSQIPQQNGWVIRFMVPSDKTLQDLPRPANTAIRLTNVAASEQLVIKFSGLWRDSTIKTKSQLLRDYADKNGLTLAGDPMIYYYDDPMTLPWRRRNEVAFLVAKTDPPS